MEHITPSQMPWTAAIIDPFDASWDQQDLNIPSFLRYGVFRFFVAIGAFILFPIYVNARSKYIVIPLSTSTWNKDINSPDLALKKALGLPNFSSPETNNGCYFNASMQMIYHLEDIKNLIRKSTPDEGSFGFTLKQKIIDLLDSMASCKTQEIKKAHQALASYYVNSEEWKNAVTKKEQAGRQQDAMELIRFFLDLLKIDHTLFRTVKQTLKREFTNYKTKEVLEKTIVKDFESLPMLLITEDDKVQDAVTKMMEGPGEKMDEFLIKDPKSDGDYKEITIKEIFHDLAKKKLSEEDYKKFSLFINSKELDLKKRDDSQWLLSNALGLKNFDSVKEEFSNLVPFFTEVHKETYTIKPDTSLLIFEIAHLNAKGQLNRKSGSFIPDESITINGERWLLQGAINRPGAHYTYLQKTGKTWFEFDDQNVTEKKEGIITISGSGTRLRSLIYKKA
jgi:hypothetical protein